MVHELERVYNGFLCSMPVTYDTKVSTRKIEQIQRWATKMVENLKDVSYSERLCIIGIPTLQLDDSGQTRFKHIKIFYGYEDIDTECFFTIDSDSYNRGHHFK